MHVVANGMPSTNSEMRSGATIGTPAGFPAIFLVISVMAVPPPSGGVGGRNNGHDGN
jgi:hypothetical protein